MIWDVIYRYGVRNIVLVDALSVNVLVYKNHNVTCGEGGTSIVA